MPKRVLAKDSVYLDLYKVRVDIFVMNTTRDVVLKVRDLCRRNGDPNPPALGEACGYTTVFTKDPAAFTIIYCSECMDINIVTHETDHLRHFIMEYKGIDDEEASANLSGYLNEIVFKFLRSKKFSI